MSHQPFEAWIFEDSELSLEQHRMLQAHLDGCTRCQRLRVSWEGVRAALRDAVMMTPEPGFELRWRAVQIEQRRRAAKRQISWALALTILAAGVLAVPLTMQVYAIAEAPASVGGALIREILGIDLTLRLAGGFVQALLGEGRSLLRPAGWAGLGLALVGFMGAWVLSLYRFVFQPMERGGSQ